MKIRKIVVLIGFILIFIMYGNVAYAANEAILELKPNSNSYKQGDEVILRVSLTNSGIENGISLVTGIFEYDNTAFEIITKDIEELTSEQQLYIEVIMQELGFAEILSVTEEYILLLSEGNLIVMNIGSELPVGATAEIGEIKFQLLSSATDGNKTIKLTTTTAEEAYLMQDAVANILVGQESVDNTNDTELDNEEDENTQTPPANTNKDGFDVEEDKGKENDKKEESDEAKQDIVYTGAEDAIPFIAIILIIAIISYIKYRKYKFI